MALVATSLLTACATAPRSREPLNLTLAKEAVRRYVASGDYARDLEAAAAPARAWIEQRAARRTPEERLAVVFDIDETALSNYRHIEEQDFGYHPAEWRTWIGRGEAPAIEPIRELYHRARRLGVDVIFLTGRSDPVDRAGTEANLRREQMGDYARLILSSSHNNKLTSQEQKTAARAALEREGWTIIATIGDQQSDLAGSHAERTFKLPNPLYLVR